MTLHNIDLKFFRVPMCHINHREGATNAASIRRVLRELFAKNHGGLFNPPQVKELKQFFDILPNVNCFI